MIEDIWIRFLQLVWVPMSNDQIVWLIAPLLFSLVMIQMYFGKYKTEQLGWNTAYANSASLMWVVVLLSKYLYENQHLLEIYPMYGYLTGGLALMTVVLGYVNYQHSLPRQLAFFLSSAIPTTVVAYLVIVIVMGGIPVDWNTLIASIVFYLILSTMLYAYRTSITTTKQIERAAKEQAKKKKREVKKIQRKIVKKLK